MLAGLPTPARAVFQYGPIQLSGNVSSQSLFRIQHGSQTFSSFNPVQLRQTLRVQYEHALLDKGALVGAMAAPSWLRRVDFFAYYRLVYDGIYDIAPGPGLEAQDGSFGGKFSQIRGGERSDIALEDVLREVFLDVDVDVWRLPISFRVGRQQIVWGEALEYRALDSVNALDLTWHSNFEAGVVGKVGFDELRQPAWTVKALANVGAVGPFENVLLEVFDIPFDFHSAKFRFLPAPWSLPLRNPIRAGLLVPIAAGLNAQLCYDFTGNERANSSASPDFSRAAVTGLCSSAGLRRSTFRQGLYDGRDPRDVNAVGGRVAGSIFGVDLSLNYVHRRHLGADIPGAGITKSETGRVNASPLDFLDISPHTTVDPVTRKSHDVVGYVRFPLEAYYPYVEVFGGSAGFYEGFTDSVLHLEIVDSHKLPIGTLDPTGKGMKKKDVVLGALGMDKTASIPIVNARSALSMGVQWNFDWIPGHEDVRVNANGTPVTGDVGTPESNSVADLYLDDRHVDRLKGLEHLLIVYASTAYRGGSLLPLVAWASDLANAPSMYFLLQTDWLVTPNVILTPALRIFTNFGRPVYDPWGIGRSSQWDEAQIKVTYQF